MSFDCLITHGRVVDPHTGIQALDIGIKQGRIAALLAPGTPADSAEVIDAAGQLVFPGLIDAHVHFGFGEPITEYSTETVYAAQGGFSTVLGHFLSNEPYGGVFEREIAHAQPRALVDFAFHFSTASELHLQELDRYVRDYGVSSFKYFMNFKGEEGRYLGLDGTDDGYLYALLQRAAALGDVTIVLHTENIEVVNRFRREAQTRPMQTLKDWAATKPPFTEAESVVRALYFAEHLGAKIYIPHLSTRMALDEVRRWRTRYDKVYVETCPHYLTHDENSELGGIGKANPPFRSPDDVAAMWEGLADGSIDVVASDHVPRKRATKEKPLWQASQGFPGTATILPVLMDQGYHKGRLSLQRIAQLLCAAPATIFGLPQKGRLTPGADADFTLVAPDFEREVRAAELGSYSDYSLYDGWRLKGWPRRTLVRGVTVMQDGRIVAPGGHGRYLRRGA
ncbi:MAG: dihydroorotase family protein [Sinobacteraceae bacterium]|nr:dihydroorotase family protein [Nevskiaceae bacterium]MCP5360211.1 dihydroorotase family protein [Nevskiaceae bacterium]MCP5466652.1 dihydroorotase family protein [Nevskiaceae bacterium]